MCLEDIRIGRNSPGFETVVAVGATPVQVVAGSEKRTHLMLGSPLTGTLTFSRSAGPVSGQGLNLAAGAKPIEFDVQVHGKLATDAWFAIGSGAGLFCAVEQTFYAEK